MIGIFGGTFDPPHLGHLILADEGRSSLDLERVLWVVAGEPPHKQDRPVTEVPHRLAMVQAAIAGDPAFEVSRADVERPPPHYTTGTLEWLREHGVKSPIALLMGSDSLIDLPNWHLPEEVIDGCARIGVMRRPGDDFDWTILDHALPDLRSKVTFFDAPYIGISGHEVRNRVREGRSYRYLVLPRVADVIEAAGLYR
ncbi:MAG: nicotinate-nucleotide adenylyltransferase [Anaerolineales bacterium]